MRLTLIALALLPLLATAAEARRSAHTFGLGFQIGHPTTFTGKYLFEQDKGIAFHIGTHPDDHYDHLRVQYEQRFVDFAQWHWADFGMYFDVGGVIASKGGDIATGPSAGVGVELRFSKFPLIVFGEIDGRAYVLGDRHHDVHGGLHFYDGVGARWYF